MLAHVLRDYELKQLAIADFREYYSCSLDGVVQASPVEAASLLCNLRPGSRIVGKLSNEAEWSEDRLISADIANTLRLLLWSLSSDSKGKAKPPKPKMIEPPSVQSASMQRSRGGAYTIDELSALLARPRGGTENQNEMR